MAELTVGSVRSTEKKDTPVAGAPASQKEQSDYKIGKLLANLPEVVAANQRPSDEELAKIQAQIDAVEKEIAQVTAIAGGSVPNAEAAIARSNLISGSGTRQDFLKLLEANYGDKLTPELRAKILSGAVTSEELSSFLSDTLDSGVWTGVYRALPKFN